MATLSTRINLETNLKLIRRAKRAGMSPEEAVRMIATKGPQFFLDKLVGATKAA